jgi:ABC-2 type transport system permease protein
MNFPGLYTLFYKEVLRFCKVILQTVLAPIVTVLLYLIVFGHVLEGRVNVFEGVSYTAFLIPGLIMMANIQNAFANSSSSLIQSKVTGNLVFVLVAPLSALELFLAFVLAATLRGLLVSLGVYVASLALVPVPLHHVGVIFLFALVAGAILGTIGLLAGIWADKFDQLAVVQNFVIMPLSFLSGVFYSIHSLPALWQTLSRFNPFFYMIDGFRFGFFGASDIDPRLSFAVVAVTFAALVWLALAALKTGYKLKG